jgi:hypothetical protein
VFGLNGEDEWKGCMRRYGDYIHSAVPEFGPSNPGGLEAHIHEVIANEHFKRFGGEFVKDIGIPLEELS